MKNIKYNLTVESAKIAMNSWEH